MTYTTTEAAHILNIPYQTLTWHLRRLDIKKEGRTYELTTEDLRRVRESLAAVKHGRPFASRC